MTARPALAPPRIRRGQTLGVVAPAGPVKLDRLRKGLARLGDTFAIRLADTLTLPRAEGLASYLAASDAQRAGELTAMLADPDVRAIILARGGYGITRILAQLDPDLLRRDPKPIVGFSDATALLAWAHTAGVRGIHGPVVVQLGDLAESDVTQLVTLLTDPHPPGPRSWPLVVHATPSTAGATLRGTLITANLTMASMLVGTPWPLPLAGAVALFEEVGERPYELDRYVTQLAMTGALAQTTAVVIGDLVRCTDANPPTGDVDPPEAALAVILERLAAAGRPCAVGAPIGHGDRNEAVPFGAACELDLARGTLAILEGAVV